MKRVPKPVFFIVALLILLLGYTSIFGFSTYNGDIKHTVFKGVGDIRWGIDIRGGVEATFKPAGDVDATDTQLEAAKAVIETRLTTGNITDYELYADNGNDRIIVRFPWKSDEKDFDPEAALEEISATAELTFRPGSSYTNTSVDSDGNPIFLTPSGETQEVLMKGDMVESAQAGIDEKNPAKKLVYLKLTSEGAEKFKEITTKYVGQTVSIWMDDVRLSAADVQEVIPNGNCSISGDFTAQEASILARQINAGALPFKLETASFGAVSATLGSSSLMAMAYAAIIAFILISLIMLIFYRLQGVVAIISLLGQLAMSLAVVSGYLVWFPSFTMTLPGIAGIILSIGMGVDANIITSERIIEELSYGKTIDGAIKKGTKSSLAAIVDGNVTVIIVSLILLLVFGPSNILSWLFGQSTTGAIYSFGFTLLMGVVANFIFGITFSRLMISSLSGYRPLRKIGLFGGAQK